MKITPINIWYNGQSVEATDLSVIIINDNLLDTAILYWQIQNIVTVERIEEVTPQVDPLVNADNDETQDEIPAVDPDIETVTVITVLSQGNSNIEGEDYLTWDGNNTYPYEYVAQQLNLTLEQ